MTPNHPNPFRSTAGAGGTTSSEKLLKALQQRSSQLQQQQQQQHQQQHQQRQQHQQQVNSISNNIPNYHSTNSTNSSTSLAMNELLQRHIATHTQHGTSNNGPSAGHPNSFSTAAATATANNLHNSINNNINSINNSMTNSRNYANSMSAGGASTAARSNLGGAPTPSSLLATNHQLALSMGLNNVSTNSNTSAPSSAIGGVGHGVGGPGHPLDSALGVSAGSGGGGVGGGAGITIRHANQAGSPARPWRRNSSLGLGTLAATLNTNNNALNNQTLAAATASIARRSSLDILGETAAALDLQEQQQRGKKRRLSPERISNNILDAHSHQDSIMMNAISQNNASSLTNPLAVLNGNVANASSNTNSLLTEIDLVKRKADLQRALQRNEAELLQAQSQRRNSMELAMQQQERRNSLDLAQRRNTLDLAQRRNSLELAQRRNSLELAVQAQALAAKAQRRNSLELALQRQRQEQQMQRRGSLELALQQQQRRNSIELALQQRRNSLEYGRRNSMELGRRNSIGSVDLSSAPRRFSMDHMYPRRNSTDLLRSNTQDALMRTILAEQLLGGAADGRRSSLPVDRRLSNMQLGMYLNPIDPNHLDSLFDDGTNAGLALGLQSQAEVREAMRRQSLLQSLNQSSSGTSNAQSLAHQAQLLKNHLAAAHQQQRLQQTAAAASANRNDIDNTKTEPELPQEQVTPFLSAVESLQEKMQKSQASQKSIQSWDKKMGLKRSHSSTMTKTHRSRKQLREYFEIQKKILEQRLVGKKGQKSGSQNNKQPSSK